MAETKWINQNGGNWNDAANWDNGVPDSTKSAIINAASFTANGKTITVNATANMLNFDCSAAAYTFTLSNAAYAFNVYGDFKDSIKRIKGFSSTGYLYFKGSSNIYSNGATQGWNRIYFDAIGATFTNQDDFTTDYIRIASGVWDTNSKSISATGYRTEGTGIKVIYFRNSIITCSTEFTFQSKTNLTFYCGTSTIITYLQFRSGGFKYYNVNVISNSYFLFQDDCIVNNFSITSTSSTSLNCNFYNNIIIENNLSLISNTPRIFITSALIGTPITITCNGTVTASNVDFRDIVGAGTANWDLSNIAGGSGDCGGNSGITFTPAIDCYIKHTSGTMNFSDATKWVTTDGGTTQARVPLIQDRAWGTANSFTGTATIIMSRQRIGSIDLSGVNQAVTFSLANAITSYGGQRFSNNVSLSGNYLWTFDGHGRTFDKVYIGVPSSFVNNLVLIGNNTFNELIIEKGRKVQITGGSTQTISPTGKLTADGTPTEPITISSTNTTPFTFAYAGTGYHQLNYCNISYCTATANRFYAGTNSINSGNNTGWLFKNYRPAQNNIRKKVINL